MKKLALIAAIISQSTLALASSKNMSCEIIERSPVSTPQQVSYSLPDAGGSGSSVARIVEGGFVSVYEDSLDSSKMIIELRFETPDQATGSSASSKSIALGKSEVELRGGSANGMISVKCSRN